MAMIEPAQKRAVAFIDGQNLFHHVREAFGYQFPNYDVRKLVTAVVASEGWNLSAIYFYTGVPDATDSPRWNGFWTKKLAAMGRQGIRVFTRPLRYRNKTVDLPNGFVHTFMTAEEKGIDVRIALDVIGKAVRDEYDVAIVFSQDRDLSEVADEIKTIAPQQGRWIRIACAYPVSPDDHEQTRHQRHAMDQDRSADVRRMYRSERLPIRVPPSTRFASVPNGVPLGVPHVDSSRFARGPA